MLLATASNAIIIGFNVRPDRNAAEVAEREKVDIRQHSIIYNVTDEMKKAMTGLLEPTLKETRLGAAEVRQIFKTPKVGTIAGCMVPDGRIARGGDAQARLLRDNVVVWHGQDRLAAPVQGRRERGQGRASSAASRSTGSTTSRSATSSKSSRWSGSRRRCEAAAMTVALLSVELLPADVAVAEGQAHGAAAAEGPARARSTSRSRKSRIRTSGSAPGSASSPSRRPTTWPSETLSSVLDEIERLEPGLVTQQPGGVPALTWPRDRVRNASAKRFARSSATLLAREVHDPGIGFVTLTRVKVSPDLQLARVYYTLHGRRQGASARHRSARSSARRRSCAARSAAAIRLRRVPELRFEFDESVEHQDRIERILLDLAGGAAGTRGRAADAPAPATSRPGDPTTPRTEDAA